MGRLATDTWLKHAGCTPSGHPPCRSIVRGYTLVQGRGVAMTTIDDHGVE
jgi:hypothetical protein